MRLCADLTHNHFIISNVFDFLLPFFYIYALVAAHSTHDLFHNFHSCGCKIYRWQYLFRYYRQLHTRTHTYVCICEHMKRSIYTFVIFKASYAHIDLNKWANNISTFLLLYSFLSLWQLPGKSSEVW